MENLNAPMRLIVAMLILLATVLLPPLALITVPMAVRGVRNMSRRGQAYGYSLDAMLNSRAQVEAGYQRNLARHGAYWNGR